MEHLCGWAVAVDMMSYYRLTFWPITDKEFEGGKHEYMVLTETQKWIKCAYIY